MLDTFMRQLCQEIELDPPLKPDLPGIYLFPLEEDLYFTISALQPTGVSLECNFGKYPKGREEELFALLLTGNLYGEGTRGAVLALDEKGEELKLTHQLDYRFEYREFRDAIEDFINVIDFWRAKAAEMK